MFKSKYLSLVILSVLLFACNSNNSSSSVSSSSSKDSSFITSSLESSSSISRDIKHVEINFSNENQSGYHYDLNKEALYNDYFAATEIIATSDCLKVDSDFNYLKIGSNSQEGYLSLSTKSGIRFDSVKMTVQGYSKYIEYSNTWSNDQSIVMVNQTPYELPYLEAAQNEETVVTHSFIEEVDNMIVASSLGRVILKSMTIYYY